MFVLTEQYNRSSLSIFMPAGMAQSVKCQPLAVSEVTLGGHSSGSLTVPRCKIGIRSRPGNSEFTLKIITCKREQSTADDGSTLVLKPMGRVNQIPKHRAPHGSTNWRLVTPNFFKKLVYFPD